MQIWDWLFRSCEVNGRILLSEGLISIGDIEESIIKGNSKKLSIRLPAWCILQRLLWSAKIDANGLFICKSFFFFLCFFFPYFHFDGKIYLLL